ncbi:MAG: sigma-70 family RNA polymerase sigma factor [Chloroflexi bacterium]|nr:sigma-70 family RNA polymerase sigma factor [Chloroflexota bacterium]
MSRPPVEPLPPAGKSEPDALLVKRAKRDPEAFGVLYERYVDRIYSYIYFRTGNEQDAEDLTARTFYQALSNLRRYNERGLPFSAWLYRIAHNLTANWYRDHARRPQVSLDDVWALMAHGQDTPPAAAERNAELAALREVIGGLPADRQQLLMLKFGEGKSNLEIGRELGRSEGAIKSLFHRTLNDLRAEMVRRGY